MASSQKDLSNKFLMAKEFTATGEIKPSGTENWFDVRAENQLRVVVEGVGGGNVLLVKGRIRNQAVYSTLATITGTSSGTTVDISLVDDLIFDVTTYSASGTPKLVASSFFSKPSSGGSGEVNTASNVGTGGVGLFDAKVSTDLQFRNINAGSAAITVTLDGANKEVDIDVDPAQIDVANLGGMGSLSNDTFVGTSSTGDIESINGWNRDTVSGGSNVNLPQAPNNLSGNFNVHTYNSNIDPIANSPNEQWTLFNEQIQIDTSDAGFSLGTAGTAATFHSLNFNHQGESDVGTLAFLNNNLTLGNGVDAISSKGFSYVYGFGTVNANVTIDGAIQGYGFQPNINAAAVMDPSTSYINAFYDFATIACAMTSYQSIALGPTIEELINNKNYSGINVNPTIDLFTGTASFFGLSVNGNLGTFDTGQFYGVNVNPIIDEINDAYGLYVSMDNVTVYAGTVSSLVVQDITYTFLAVGDNNSITIEYINDGTAGAETANLVGNAIEVHIQSGVSTATQVKAAIDANFTIIANLTAVITGTASNAQVTTGPTNFAGGTNAGTKRAAYLDGNVEITGSLTFGGALSIGKLNAFATQAVVDTGGVPASVHGLISQLTVADNLTIANDDTFGVNTAALIVVGDNCTLTSGALNIGLAGLGLPAVVTIGASSTVEDVAGAVFALSMDGGAGAGSAITNVNLCSATSIPNGITTVTNLKGYNFYLPFGDPGTTTWGVYMAPATAHNYMAGDLVIGTADLPTNSSVGLELVSTTKAMLVSRMTTTEKNALTAVNGMIVYDTTLNKFQGYEAGAWANLI